MVKTKRKKVAVQVEIPAQDSRVVPYDTGKIKIGCAYERPRPVYTSTDDIWQDVYMGNRRHKNVKQTVAAWVGGAVIVFLYLYFLFGVLDA